MTKIELEYTPKGFETWEDTIYDFLNHLYKRGKENLFSKVWAMMYGKGIIDDKEKEDLEYEQKYFLPFCIAYDKAMRRFIKEHKCYNFGTTFYLSFVFPDVDLPSEKVCSKI